MDDKKKRVMVTSCPDKPDTLPCYCFEPVKKEKKKTLDEFREDRKLEKGDGIEQRLVVCNIDVCHEFAEVMLEYDVPGVTPDFQEKKSIRVGGRSVTCLCQKHYDRLNMRLTDRIFTLEERVDELEKLIERAHEIFEYRKDLD